MRTDSSYTKARIKSIDDARVLSEEGINIQMISASEIKTSVVIDEKYMELAVRALHKAFDLDQPAAWHGLEARGGAQFDGIPVSRWTVQRMDQGPDPRTAARLL